MKNIYSKQAYDLYTNDDIDGAVELYKKAINNGEFLANFELALIYIDNPNKFPDKRIAIPYLKTIAISSFPQKNDALKELVKIYAEIEDIESELFYIKQLKEFDKDISKCLKESLSKYEKTNLKQFISFILENSNLINDFKINFNFENSIEKLFLSYRKDDNSSFEENEKFVKSIFSHVVKNGKLKKYLSFIRKCDSEYRYFLCISTLNYFKNSSQFDFYWNLIFKTYRPDYFKSGWWFDEELAYRILEKKVKLLLEEFDDINNFIKIKECINKLNPNSNDDKGLSNLYILMAQSYLYGSNKAEKNIIKAKEYVEKTNIKGSLYYEILNRYNETFTSKNETQTADNLILTNPNPISSNIEKQKIKDIIKKRNIKYLVHITRKSNLDSIRKRGLLSQKELLKNNIKVDVLDDKNETNNISLSITNVNKWYRDIKIDQGKIKLEEVAIVKVLPSVLYESDNEILFYEKNSKIPGLKGGTKAEDFEVLFKEEIQYFSKLFLQFVTKNRKDYNMPDNVPTDDQAEIVVKGKIDPKFIIIE